MELIQDDAKNKGGKCANHLCGFRLRGINPKANYYDTARRSWVCASCAQSLNREVLGKSLKSSIEFRQRCISSEDALMLMLSTASSNSS